MPDPLVDALAASRERTFALVAHLDDGQLERQIDPIMSPLVWDLGHIAAYEDLWLVHRFADEPLLHPELAARYDAFETPRAVRGDIELLDADGAREYLAEVRERTLAAIDARGVDPVLHEMVIRHELQHTETMRQAMRLGGLLAPGDPALATLRRRRAGASGSTSPPGPPRSAPRTTGSPTTTSARAIASSSRAFRIARRPVTNATWLHFTEGGGYQRREWWSDEGWAWKEDYDIGQLSGRRGGTPGRSGVPRLLVRGRRLRPLTRSTAPHRGGVGEGGDLDPRRPPGHRTGRGSGPRRWFDGYPGFVAHPYREYSEVFFGDAVPRAARRLVGDRPARRHRHLPQLGPPAAPADLRRRPARHRRRGQQMTPLLTTDAIVVESFVGAGDERSLADDVLDGLTRPVQGAAAQALLRRARAPSCSTASASCPSTTRRGPSARSSRRAARRSSRPPARRSSSSSARARAAKTRLLLRRDGRGRHARRYVPFDVTESMVLACADELVERVPGPARARRRRRLRAPPAPRPARPTGPAHRRLPRRHDRQLPAGHAAALPARASPSCCVPARPPAARHRPGQGPGACSRPPTTTAPA